MGAPARNRSLELIRRECEAFGVTDWNHNYLSGGHLEIRWRHNGHSNVVVASKTPSDHRSPLNARGEIRKQFRAVGLEPIKVEKQRKNLRLVSSNEPMALLKNGLEELRDDHEALTDVILDIFPTVNRIAELTGKITSGDVFRMQVEVSGQALGRILSVIATEEPQAIGSVRFKLASTPKPIVEPQQEVLPPETTVAETASVPTEAPTPIIETVEVVETPVESIDEEEVIPRPQKHELLIHIYNNGPQTIEALHEAGITGYGDKPEMLSHLLEKQKRDGHLVNKNGEWKLTRDGALFAKDKIKNPIYRRRNKKSV
jgi:hypothetical protein